jgi:opacity protein-like surface antigen
MRSRIALLALFALLVSSAVFAQVRRGTIEISPFAGYLFGGQFARGTTALFDTDADVDDHATYGVRLGYNVTSKFEVELQASRTETAFVTHDKNRLFGASGSSKLGDLDIDYLLANFTFNFGHRRAVPYITIGGGAARLSPSVPGVQASREYKGTGTLGAGVKVFFNPHFGLRFDGRYYATWIRDDNNNRDRSDRCDRDHSFRDCSDRRDWLTNGDVTGGLVFAF